MISPAPISHVAYFDGNVFINLGSSFALPCPGHLSSSIVELIVVIVEEIAKRLVSIGIKASLFGLLSLLLLSINLRIRLTLIRTSLLRLINANTWRAD